MPGAVETMAAVMGGAQSIFTCAFDEAFQIPTETSAELAVRTQQIIAFESGIGRTVDPLGGSYFLEQHTDRMEESIAKVMGEIDEYGGVVRAIEDGWIQMRLAERGLERKLKTDSGETVRREINALEAMSNPRIVRVIWADQTGDGQWYIVTELLEMSRSYVIRLLDEGELPFRLAGNHRCISLRDLLAFRKRFAEMQRDALDQMALDAWEAGLYDNYITIPEGGTDQ